MPLLADVPGPLEHHVLKQMGESGEPRPFVGRADMIPDIHRHQRQPVVFEQNHIEAVGESVFFEIEHGHGLKCWHNSHLAPFPIQDSRTRLLTHRMLREARLKCQFDGSESSIWFTGNGA